MKSEHVFIIILAIAIAGVGTYSVIEIQNLHEENDILTAELGQSKIQFTEFAQSTTDSLTKLVTELDLTRTTFNQSVESVKGSLVNLQQQSEAQLALLRNESQQRFDNLEDTIALNVQSTDFSQIIKQAVKSVVSIQTNTGVGSGAFIQDGGYIVTNYHVIKGATSAAVITSDNKRHGVRIVGVDTDSDIAILQIEEDYPVLAFTRRNPSVGERVIAVGNPGGLQLTVTEGIISATERKDSAGNTYLQTDVPINPGNSGGPLIDASGEIVGINTLKVSGFEGIGFALTAEQVSDIARDLIDKDQARAEIT